MLETKLAYRQLFNIDLWGGGSLGFAKRCIFEKRSKKRGGVHLVLQNVVFCENLASLTSEYRPVHGMRLLWPSLFLLCLRVLECGVLSLRRRNAPC